MHKFKYKNMLVLLLLLMFVLTGCSGKKFILTTGFGGDEVFRIDGEKCELKEVLVYLVNMENQYKTMYGDEFVSVSINDIPITSYLKESALAMVYKVRIMNLMAETYDITLTGEEKDRIKNAAQEYYDSLSKEERSAMGGVGKGDIQRMYEEYAIAEKLYEYLIKDVNPEISDDDARTVVLKEIFISSSQDVSANSAQSPADIANEAYTKAMLEEDFDLLVAQYSDRDDSLVYVRKGELATNLETVVFNMSEGDISQVLNGMDGYYIFYCVNAADESRTEANKQEIIQQRRDQAFNSVYSSFAAERKYYLNEELWNDFEIPDGENVITASFFEVFDSYFYID